MKKKFRLFLFFRFFIRDFIWLFVKNVEKYKVFDFSEVRNKILKKSSEIIKMQIQMNRQSKNIWSKKSNGNRYIGFCPKIGFFRFRNFFPKGLKISFPTNFTMLYPNLQNK
jgi:hypothetical protein